MGLKQGGNGEDIEGSIMLTTITIMPNGAFCWQVGEF